MMRDWITDQGLLLGPAFALLMFLAIFAFIIFWIFRPGSSSFYKQKAMMPLEDSGPAAGKSDQPIR